MPAVKKDPTVRRRRNKASTRTVLPRVRENVVVPVIPARPEDNPWHDEVRRWWDAAWASPMASQWDMATDRHNMIIAAMHLDDMWKATSASARQKADTFFKRSAGGLGLTPYDRRRLEWSMPGPDEPVDDADPDAPADDAPAPEPVKKQRRKTTGKGKKPVDPRALLAS